MNKVFTKFRRGRIRGNVTPGTAWEYTLNHGDFGLISEEKGRLTEKQLEECRRTMTREMNKAGKIWIRVFPDISVTSKPISTRMGKGKGSIDHRVARVREGMTLFEVIGVPSHIAKNALLKAEKKLPVKARVIERPHVLKPTQFT